MGKVIVRSLILVLLLLFFPQHGQAEDSLWSQGQSFFEQGKFADAVDAYERLQQQHPDNGHILFNLGNAYYKNNQKGAAVAAYLASQRLLPRDPDIKANLQFVAKKLNLSPVPIAQGLQGVTGLLFPYASVLNEREHGWFFMTFLVGFLMILGLALVRNRKNIWFLTSFMCFLSVYQGLAVALTHNTPFKVVGAVRSAMASAYAGPQRDGAFPEVFQLQEGFPLAVKETRPEWVLIVLPDGRQGWLLSSDVTIF